MIAKFWGNCYVFSEKVFWGHLFFDQALLNFLKAGEIKGGIGKNTNFDASWVKILLSSSMSLGEKVNAY